VNPHERLHTLDDSDYHDNHVVAGQVDELLCSFNIDLDSTLNSLFSDANDITDPEQRKQTLRKKD
jgi:hypothetical protein